MSKLLDPTQAQELISRGEGQRLEFKTSFAEENGAIESLGAFSNAQGGSVLFGVKPNGEPCGVEIGENTLENFANKLRRESEPPLLPRIEMLEVEGALIVFVEVAAVSPGQLVHVFSKALVRVGRTNQIMSATQQRAQLLGNADSGPLVAVSGATSADGREGFAWIENPGTAEHFSVRMTQFHTPNLSMEIRVLWSNGAEERKLKRGERDWCRLMVLEPDAVSTSLGRDGHMYVPIGRRDDLRRQHERRQQGTRIVRFLGEPQAVDILIEQGREYSVEIVVLSDTRTPTRAVITYGVGGGKLVIPYDENIVGPLVESELEIRRKIEAMLGDAPTDGESGTEP